MTRTVERHPDTSGTEVDGEMFLVKAMDEDIYHLDTIATGLWRLLEHPCRPDTLEKVLVDAFPDVAAETIQTDVSRALDALIEAGYVLANDTAGEPTDAGLG